MRPQSHEAHAWYFRYIDKVEGEDGLLALEQVEEQLQQLFASLTPEQWSFRYAEGKWSPKEMLGHLIDSERIFAFRAVSIARGEKQSLPGFEQDDYVENGGHHERSPESLLEERKTVRASTLSLFRYFSPTHLAALGTANDSPISPNAILFALTGHDLHHLEVLKERYL